MNKRQSILIAMAGASLFATSQAMAQINYQNEDLLLDFRNVASPSDADVTIDLGPVSTFLSRTGTTQLNTTANNGYTPVFSEGDILGQFGGAPLDGIGFTAAAANNTLAATTQIWMTRAGLTQAYPDVAPNSAGADEVGQAVYLIGYGAGGNNGEPVTPVDGSDPIVSVPAYATPKYSYQSVAASVNSASVINFGGESANVYSGGSLESYTSAGSTVYSALYLQTPGVSPSTYLGYFTFNGTTGELDFTAGLPPVTVPNLNISETGTTVTISWTNTGSFVLQQSSDLTHPNGWAASGYTVSVNNGTASVTIPSPVGNAYFRLYNPE